MVDALRRALRGARIRPESARVTRLEQPRGAVPAVLVTEPSEGARTYAGGTTRGAAAVFAQRPARDRAAG